jgi:uncharacterized coiled-coil protein SlyX
MRRKKHSGTMNPNMKVRRDGIILRHPFFQFFSKDAKVIDMENPSDDSDHPLEEYVPAMTPDPSGQAFLLLQQVIEAVLSLKYCLSEDVMFPERNKEPIFLDRERPDELGNTRIIWKGDPSKLLSLRPWIPFLDQVMENLIRLRSKIGSNRDPGLPPRINDQVPDYQREIEVLKDVIRELEDDLSDTSSKEVQALRTRVVHLSNRLWDIKRLRSKDRKSFDEIIKTLRIEMKVKLKDSYQKSDQMKRQLENLQKKLKSLTSSKARISSSSRMRGIRTSHEMKRILSLISDLISGERW